MPAITLGLAEVEERLQALRRRLNVLTLLHASFLSLSAVALLTAALIVLGLRGTVSNFRIATWSGTLAAAGVAVACFFYLRQRWLGLHDTALLADRRAQLTDRLTTLIDLRARPRPSRLAPVLVAQAMALGSRWQPQRIAPRRIPRSLFLFVAALLVLLSTAFMSRHDPSRAPVAQVGAGLTASANPVPGQALLDAPKLGGNQGKADGAGDVSGTLPPGNLARSGSDPSKLGDELGPGDSLGRTGTSPSPPDGLLASLPDRLQEAIRRAFRAAAADRPRDLAAQSEKASDDGARRTNHEQTAQKSKPGEAKAEKQQPGDRSKPGNQPGQKQAQAANADAANQNFEGTSPAAGEGSNPGGLMEGAAPTTTAGQGAPPTFKLTITSFLRAVEQQGNQPRQPGKQSAASAALGANSGGEQVALSERQLNDDALRKVEIPPEYEDLVRRVYSGRAAQ